MKRHQFSIWRFMQLQPPRRPTIRVWNLERMKGLEYGMPLSKDCRRSCKFHLLSPLTRLRQDQEGQKKNLRSPLPQKPKRQSVSPKPPPLIASQSRCVSRAHMTSLAFPITNPCTKSLHNLKETLPFILDHKVTIIQKYLPPCVHYKHMSSQPNTESTLNL